MLLASWASRLLVRQLSTPGARSFLDLSLDWRVLAFTIGVTVMTALLFGAVPAVRASGVAPMEALKEHGPSFARGASVGRRFGVAGRINLPNSLVVAQVALSLILVVAAGLFMKTFSSLANLISGSIAIACCSSTSIPSARRFRRPIAWRPISASATRSSPSPESRPPRCRLSHRSAA